MMAFGDRLQVADHCNYFSPSQQIWAESAPLAGWLSKKAIVGFYSIFRCRASTHGSSRNDFSGGGGVGGVGGCSSRLKVRGYYLHTMPMSHFLLLQLSVTMVMLKTLYSLALFNILFSHSFPAARTESFFSIVF